MGAWREWSGTVCGGIREKRGKMYVGGEKNRVESGGVSGE